MAEQPILSAPQPAEAGRVIAPTATALQGLTALTGVVAQGIQQAKVKKSQRQVDLVGREVSQVATDLIAGTELSEAAQLELDRLKPLTGEPTRQIELQARLSSLEGRLRADGVSETAITKGFADKGLIDPNVALANLAIEAQEIDIAADRAAVNAAAADIARNNPALLVIDEAGRIDQVATVQAAQGLARQVEDIKASQQASVDELTGKLRSVTMRPFIQAQRNLQLERGKPNPDPEKIGAILNNMSALKTRSDIRIAEASFGRSEAELDLIQKTVIDPMNQLFASATGELADLSLAGSIATTNTMLANMNERNFRVNFNELSALKDVFGDRFISDAITLTARDFGARIELGEKITQKTLDFMNGIGKILTGEGIVDPGSGKDAGEGNVVAPQVLGDVNTINGAFKALRTITSGLVPEHFQPKTGPTGETTSTFDIFATSMLGNTNLRKQMDLDDMTMLLGLATSDGFVASLAEQRKQSPEIADRLVGNYSIVVTEVFSNVVSQEVAAGRLPKALLDGPLFIVDRETGKLSINPDIAKEFKLPAGMSFAEARDARRRQRTQRFPSGPTIRTSEAQLREATTAVEFEDSFNSMLEGFAKVSPANAATLLDVLKATGVVLVVSEEQTGE